MQMNRKDGKEYLDFVQNNGNCPLTLVLFHGLEYREMRNRSIFCVVQRSIRFQMRRSFAVNSGPNGGEV